MILFIYFMYYHQSSKKTSKTVCIIAYLVPASGIEPQTPYNYIYAPPLLLTLPY